MSGDTGRAKIADVVNNRWGWSEIHWSTPDPLDFELDKYTCPIVDEYSIEGSVPDVVGLPAEYHEKTLKQMHDEFSAGAGDLHGELKRRAEQHLKSRTASNPAHTAQIGKKITQWIIVEIQPVIGVEYGILSSFPAVDLWAFLQPFQIGDKKRMKADRGWVSDDWPRAGWFRTSIRWFPKYDAKGNLLPHFTPMMAVYGRFGSAHKVMEWREIPCRLTREKTKSIDRHIVRPSYGAGSRFLFKLPVEVENMPTAEDQERKKQAAELLKSNSQLTDKQQDQLLRFEAGAYLKIWARNAFMDWGKDGTPRDDDSETCMKHMQELDNAELYARQKLNALFNSPLSGFSVPVDNTTGNPDDPNYYVKYYNDFSPQNILRQVHASGVFEPDRLAQDSLRQFMAGFRMAVAQKSDPLAGLASEERSDSSITEGAIKEQKDRFVPEIFQETPDKELRYLCGKDYFRPYSFRNHTWKRNKFSTDGTYHDDLWLHVMLWPAEILDDLRNLDGYFFKEPSKASLPLFFCVSLVYVAMLRILGGTVSKALADPKRKALAKKLKSLYEWEELPAIAAMIACYGLPNPAEVRWQGNKPKTVLNMLKYMKERLGSGEQSDVGAGRVTHEQIINQLYKFIQAAIGAATYVPREAGASTQKMFLDAIAGVKYRSRDGFSDCEFFKPEPSVSALEQKIGLELTIASRTQKLAAWPVPAPLLQWLAFAITLKMALKGKGEVDFGGLFGPDAKERSVEFSLEPEGEAGVFFDLAAVWTLAAELDSAFTGAKLSSAKGEDLPDHPMTEALKRPLVL